MKDKYTLEELRELKKKVSIDEILNKKGIVYKARREELEPLTEDALLEEMAKEPKLIRRPIIILEDQVIVGYDEDRLNKLLK